MHSGADCRRSDRRLKVEQSVANRESTLGLEGAHNTREADSGTSSLRGQREGPGSGWEGHIVYVLWMAVARGRREVSGWQSCSEALCVSGGSVLRTIPGLDWT